MIDADVRQKEAALKDRLASFKRLAVAFSGGVDSSLLAVLAHDVLGAEMVAVTIDSAFLARRELAEAKDIAERFGFRHVVLEEAIEPEVLKNERSRCYACKRGELGAIKAYAASEGIGAVADGMNADDLGDFRPGAAASRELGVASPFRDAGVTKAEIRALAFQRGLPNWDKPANACLASRVPSGQEITMDALRMIESAEDFLRGEGFRQLRVRNHAGLARIEIGKDELASFLDAGLMARTDEELKRLGFRYVTLDLGGYAMGSVDGRHQAGKE